MKWYNCIVFVFLMGCKQGSEKEVPSKTGDVVQFRLSPDLSRTYSYEIENESEMSQEVNEEKIENNSTIEMGMDYSFSKDTSGNLKVTMVYRKFKLSVKMMEIEKELDASSASSSIEPSDKMFAAFNNARLNAVIDSAGSIKSIDGFQAIRDKMAGYAGTDKEALQMLNGSIQQYVSEAFFRQTLEQNFKFVTTRPVKVGDVISQTTPVNADFKVNMSVVYTVAFIEDDMAVLNAKASIDIKDEPIVIEGTNVLISMKGGQTGKIRIDISTGLLQESTADLRIKGILGIMGRQIPFKLNTRSRISLSQ